MTNSILISMLDWYTIDGERNDLLPHFSSNGGNQETMCFRSGKVRCAQIDKETSFGFER